MGLFLDQTRSGTGTSYLGRDVITDIIDATRQITSSFTASVLFESGRRLHVHLHHVSYTCRPIKRLFDDFCPSASPQDSFSWR